MADLVGDVKIVFAPGCRGRSSLQNVWIRNSEMVAQGNYEAKSEKNFFKIFRSANFSLKGYNSDTDHDEAVGLIVSER